MNKIISASPNYGLAEYLLILNAHEELRNKVFHIKQVFQEKYKVSLSATKPHITLVNFVTWQMMEERIVNRLKVIAMGTSPFKVDLKDYGSFPTHTIYINVVTKNAIQRLIKELHSAQRLMKSPDRTPHFITEPHLTIARKLNAMQYEQGWHEYAHRHFTGSFIADCMLLLRRSENKPRYQIVQRFEFMNLPISIKQGDLFM